MGRKKEEHETALVKNYISTALLLLMEQNDYQSITVTDIAKKPEFHADYYRTYSSKEDILIQYFNNIANDFISEIKVPSQYYTLPTCRAFFYLFSGTWQFDSHIKKSEPA